jgi:hypothetical protein
MLAEPMLVLFPEIVLLVTVNRPLLWKIPAAGSCGVNTCDAILICMPLERTATPPAKQAARVTVYGDSIITKPLQDDSSKRVAVEPPDTVTDPT